MFCWSVVHTGRALLADQRNKVKIIILKLVTIKGTVIIIRTSLKVRTVFQTTLLNLIIGCVKAM